MIAPTGSEFKHNLENAVTGTLFQNVVETLLLGQEPKRHAVETASGSSIERELCLGSVALSFLSDTTKIGR